MALATPVVARADLITSISGHAVQDPATGVYTYTYTAANLPGSTDTLGGLTVNVDPLADVSGITGPAGWQSFIDPADGLVLWASPDPSTDILPGSFDLFSFLSPLPPVSQDYLAIGFSDIGIDFNTGTTVGPGVPPAPAVAVPEPGSLLVFGAGIAALIGFRWKRSKRFAAGCGL
jgi:hypothetical protein